jgi:hypothetical protein
MRVECVRAVQEAIGREITQAEQQGIDTRVVQTMRRLASREPERWSSMSRGERLQEAANVIGQDLSHAAELRDLRTALQIEAHARHVPEIQAAGTGGFDVIHRKLHQADRYVKGVNAQLRAEAFDMIDFATRQENGSVGAQGVRWLANLSDPGRALAFAREVFAQDTGDAGAKAAAGAWRKVADSIRERFNRMGGDVGKLSSAYLPTLHNAAAIERAGIEGWVSKILPRLDRSRYTDERGRPLRDGEMAEMLEQAWRDITTDGLASAELGAYRGEGTRANAGSQHRALHFKDGDAYFEYHVEFGEGNAFDAVTTHLRSMAKNIGLVEQFGPNPNATMRTMLDVARLGKGNDRFAGLYTVEDGWNTLRGSLDNPRSQTRARIGQGLRDLEVIGKLQKTPLGSVSDIPLYFMTLGYNRLPFWQGAANLVRAMGPDATHFANVAGLMGEGVIADVRSAADGMIGSGWLRGMANATMKVTLLQQLTDATRRALSVSMMAGMARLARTPWDQLHHYDQARLKTAGWTPDEFAVLQRVQPEDWRGTEMLTPAAVMKVEGVDLETRQRAVARLLGVIVDESEYASPAPDLRTRTVASGTLQRGTGGGELYRSLMLFKGYGLSIMFRHWSRVFNGDMSPASRVGYASGLIFGLTMAGATTLQLYDLFAGRDPRDATGDAGDDPERLLKFWTAAFFKGGGAGFVGDLLLNNESRGGQSPSTIAVGGLAGPVIGSGLELVKDIGLDNLMEAARGEDTNIGAESFRWARSHAPLINTWYASLALDQAVLNQAQEFLSPGFLAKARSRMEKQWHSQFWWGPSDSGLLTGDMTRPERTPNLAEAVGR